MLVHTQVMINLPMSGTTIGNSNPSPIEKPQEIRERKDKGLYFHYEEKYATGHRCKNQNMFRLEIIQEEESLEE